jgi:citrate lyase alpha subunit
LHDVIEDTRITAKRLIKRGIPAELVDVVSMLSHGRLTDEQYLDMIRHIKKSNPIAVNVKRQDLIDNLNVREIAVYKLNTPEKLEKFKRRYKKYKQALDILNKE